MANVHGVAGEWARVKGMVAGLWPLFLGVFAAGIAVAMMFTVPIYGVTMLVLTIAYVIWRLLAGLRHVERFFKGARGEEKVSGILANLSDKYHVFNDFTVGRNHIDHVVVGPGGVFAIETKFWNGRVTLEEDEILLDGQLPNRSPLPQVVREAALVKGALSKAGWNGQVTPVLAFASDTFATRRANARGAVVINSSELREAFDSDRVVIAPLELDRLVGIMENCQ